jgi:hypothetical protein
MHQQSQGLCGLVVTSSIPLLGLCQQLVLNLQVLVNSNGTDRLHRELHYVLDLEAFTLALQARVLWIAAQHSEAWACMVVSGPSSGLALHPPPATGIQEGGGGPLAGVGGNCPPTVWTGAQSAGKHGHYCTVL